MAVIHIHAGLPKTGTTALQKFLALNRARLSARGLEVPEVGFSAAGDHHAIFWAMSGLPGQSAVSPDAVLRALPRDSGTEVLLSSELALLWLRWGRGAKSLAKIRAAGHRLLFHVFVRPQAALIASLYPETMRNLVMPFAFESFAEVALRELSDFQALAARVARINGAEFRALPFTEAWRETGPWWALLESLGLTISPSERVAFALPGEVNRSPGPAGVAALRQALAQIAAEGRILRLGQRLDLRRVALEISRNLPAEAAGFWPYLPGEAARITAQCAPANRAFAESYFHHSWSDLFAEEEAAAAARPQSVTASDAEIAIRQSAIYAALSRRLDEIKAGRRRRPVLRRLVSTLPDKAADMAFRRAVRRKLGQEKA